MNKYDEPICGASNMVGDFLSKGQLFFDGRAQGQPFYAESEGELIRLAKERKAALIAEFSGFPTFLFAGEKWELKIFAQ